MEAQLQTNSPENISVPEKLAIEVAEMVKDYSNLVVTEETLPQIKLAHEVVKSKRVELDNIRKDGTTQFESLKRQFQSSVDKFIVQLQPVEYKLRSDLNKYSDETEWKKAEKDGTVKGYTSYLNKFDNSKFEYKGTHVAMAKARISEIENLAKKQEMNYADFAKRVNNFAFYKTSESAREGLTKLEQFPINVESFGDKVSDAMMLKAQSITNLNFRIDELVSLEKEKAEQERIRKEQEAEAAKMKAEQERIQKEIDEKMKDLKAEEEKQRQAREEAERKEKELAEQKAKLEREEAERIEKAKAEEAARLRKEELAAKGEIEIDNVVFKIEELEEVKRFFKTSYIPDEAYKVKDSIERMNHQKSLGKATHDDLTDKQRANEAIRKEVFNFLEEVKANIESNPVLSNALTEGIITKNEIGEYFKA